MTELQRATESTRMALFRLRQMLDDREDEVLEIALVIRDLEAVLDHLEAQ